MSDPMQIDNRSEVGQVRKSVWLFMAVLLSNGLVMWAFDLSGIVKTSAVILIAAGIPLLFWISLVQETVVVEAGPQGVKYMVEKGRELVVRNEIRKEEIDRIVVVKEGATLYWCRVVPKAGRGILLGNFQDKHLPFINRLVETWPEKVRTCEVTAEEKKAKGSHDCIL
jgi:hypothetical protein